MQEKFADFASQMTRNPHTLAQLRELMEDAERRQEISARIKMLRERRALTQSQVAKAVGVELRTYQNWEAGGGTSHENYESLAEILGTSFDYLLTGGETAPPAEDVLGRLDAIEARLAAVEAAEGEILARLRFQQAEQLSAKAAERLRRELRRSPEAPSERTREGLNS